MAGESDSGYFEKGTIFNALVANIICSIILILLLIYSIYKNWKKRM